MDGQTDKVNYNAVVHWYNNKMDLKHKQYLRTKKIIKPLHINVIFCSLTDRPTDRASYKHNADKYENHAFNLREQLRKSTAL